VKRWPCGVQVKTQVLAEIEEVSNGYDGNGES
jgi:hypothetical protein